MEISLFECLYGRLTAPVSGGEVVVIEKNLFERKGLPVLHAQEERDIVH